MTDGGAVIMIFMGLFALLFMFVAGDYYTGMVGPPGKRKPLPQWFGHLWFMAFAAIMLYFGVGHFLKKR